MGEGTMRDQADDVTRTLEVSAHHGRAGDDPDEIGFVLGTSRRP